MAAGRTSGASLEVLDALVPAAQRLDTVIVPLVSGQPLAFTSRGPLIRGLDAWLVAMQRRLDGPAGVDAPLFKHGCALICEIESLAADTTDRRVWQATNSEILHRVLWIARRDPGRRVLVVQCHRLHWLELQLRRHRDEVLLCLTRRCSAGSALGQPVGVFTHPRLSDSPLSFRNSRAAAWSLILTYPTFLVPGCTSLLTGHFPSIRRELKESALTDGASRIQAMLRIVVPLAIPGASTLSWNEYIYALVFLTSTANRTIPVGVVNELIRGDLYFC
jgi:Binding-protein-dependent transport system inner membrane component